MSASTDTPSASTEWRNKGNTHYKTASVEGLAPTIVASRLTIACEYYQKAKKEAKNIDDEASACKNIATASFRIAKIYCDQNREISEHTYHYKEALINFCLAADCGSRPDFGKDSSWQETTLSKLEDCLAHVIKVASEMEINNRVQTLNFFASSLQPEKYTYGKQTRFSLLLSVIDAELAEALRAISDNDFRFAKSKLAECHTPLVLAEELIQNDSEEMELNVQKEDIILNTCVAEALQAYDIGKVI